MKEVKAELQSLREQAQLTESIVTPVVLEHSHSFAPKHSCQDLRVLYTHLEEEQEHDDGESRKRRLETPAKRLHDVRAVSPSNDTGLRPAHDRCVNFRVTPCCCCRSLFSITLCLCLCFPIYACAGVSLTCAAVIAEPCV